MFYLHRHTCTIRNYHESSVRQTSLGATSRPLKSKTINVMKRECRTIKKKESGIDTFIKLRLSKNAGREIILSTRNMIRQQPDNIGEKNCKTFSKIVLI